jgi:flagellar protein FlbD
VIKITLLDNQQIAINAELIERIESVPETVITLTNNKKILVLETLDEIISAVIQYRHLAYGDKSGEHYRGWHPDA